MSFRNAGMSNWYGLAISAGGTGDGSNAILWTYLPDNAEQVWELTPVLAQSPLPPAWALKNYNSGKCLAIPGSSKVAGTYAVQWSCNGL